MTEKSPPKVIEDLGDGLVMRSARREDAGALADFCAKAFIHEESGTEAYWIADWIRDLVANPHPTLNIDDVIIVEDVNNDRIASTTTYLTQTWTYDGVEFEIGRPEIVGTDHKYRNRGLIRKQFDLMHQWASERGHLVQVVLGIPTYYRQFGYEYALHAEGGRYTPTASLPRWSDENRDFQLRDATEDDVPFITRLLQESSKHSLVSPVFREDEVRYMTFDRTGRSAVRHRTAILCKSHGKTIGEPIGVLMYAMVTPIDEGVILRVEMSEPKYWRNATRALLSEIVELAKKASDEDPDPEREIKRIRQDMQPDHPIYIFDDGALGQPPERQYGWYVRVPDIADFIRKIAPALEHRIANSVHAGFSGSLKIQLHRHGITVEFKDGKIDSVENIPAVSWDNANASFPGLTFLPVLFGMRSVSETLMSHTDANTGSKADRHLIETLFPKKPSDIALTLT